MSKIIPLFVQALLLVVFLSGCDKEVEKEIQTVARTAGQQQPAVPGWSAHIVSAPYEWVSASRPLKISFSHSVTGEQALNTPLEGVVAVEPQLTMKVFFSNERELTVEFPEPLKREVRYTFTLAPDKLDGIEKTLQPYRFSVQAFKQDFSLQIDGLQIDPSSEEHTVTGTVETNDAALPADVERILSAAQDGATRTIEWRHDSDTGHDFTVKGITRSEQASSLKLDWNGAAIGVDKKGSQAVHIPSLSSFDVVSAVSRQGAEQLIEVNFSEALHRSQSLKGLIEIDGKSPKNTLIDGNRIRIYPDRKLSGEVTVRLLPGIRSTKDAKTLERFEKKLTFLSENPGVRFVGTGYIIPRQANMVVPIEAVNVDSVQITAYRTPLKNMGQFIQSSNLTRRYSDNETSAIQWRKTYALPEVPKDKWQKYDLDLNTLVQNFGSDMFALEIRIDLSNIILDCGVRPQHNDEIQDADWPTQSRDENPAWVEQYYQSSGYVSWSEQSNPCSRAYYHYNNSGIARSFRYFSSSNLGLIAKMAVDHRVTVAVTDINTALPLKGVKVTAYNYQHQPVANAETDADGFLSFVPVSAPHYLIAEHKDNVSFLRLLRNETLSTNVFDVGGDKTSSGVKGFFYGERDVWRPGDDIFLTFIVQDKAGNFPDNYPLTVDFFDPKGTKKDSITNANPLNGFYSFRLKTQEQSPTGNWRAVIRYGNQYFDKRIPVEAIVPNRLKIELQFPAEVLAAKRGKFDVGFSPSG
jgi:alpha-2-macroglobulin